MLALLLRTRDKHELHTSTGEQMCRQLGAWTGNTCGRVGGQELPGTGMGALAAAVTQELGTILPRLACPRAPGTPLLASVCSHKVPSLTGVLCKVLLHPPGR